MDNLGGLRDGSTMVAGKEVPATSGRGTKGAHFLRYICKFATEQIEIRLIIARYIGRVKIYWVWVLCSKDFTIEIILGLELRCNLSKGSFLVSPKNWLKDFWQIVGL